MGNYMKTAAMVLVLVLAGAARGKDAAATRPASGPSTRASEQDERIAKGLRREYVVIGMTLKQVEGICGKGELKTAGERDETWIYYPLDVHHDWLGDGTTAETGAAELTCTFRDGKLSRLRRTFY